jgi:hypothetical protein
MNRNLKLRVGTQAGIGFGAETSSMVKWSLPTPGLQSRGTFPSSPQKRSTNRTGNFVYFDSKTHRINPAHVIASGSLPPGFPGPSMATTPGHRYFAGLSRNSFLLAFASLFADISAEMLYPILPIFLTQTLKASGSVVGLIEGIAGTTRNIVQGI